MRYHRREGARPCLTSVPSPLALFTCRSAARHPLNPAPESAVSCGSSIFPWPAANEDALRDAATDWHRLAEAIRDNYGPASSAADSLTLNNAGAAITAFENYWQKFGGRKGALPLGAEACDAMSAACTNYARDVAAVKRLIEERALEIGAILVVGAIGAFLTFGATEAAADTLAAGLAASAGRLDR
jgi:hypothetical protein